MDGHRMENKFWEQTLANLATHLGVEDPKVTTPVTCVDRKRQWSQAKNVKHSVDPLDAPDVQARQEDRWVA